MSLAVKKGKSVVRFVKVNDHFKFGFICPCLITQETTHSSFVEKLDELLSKNTAILYLKDKMTY